MPGFDDMVLVGTIARTQGHRGQVILNPATDFPERRFAIGSVLHTRKADGDATLRVTAMRLHQGRPVVSFEGIETMTAAEALAGLELRVPESDLAELPPGTYYEHDLVGCEVVTTGGQVVGRVRAIVGGCGVSRLVIGVGRAEVQVPLVEVFCPLIDVAARRIVVSPPDGLLDLNA
jgi:16S rRNA processing protein RimM